MSASEENQDASLLDQDQPLESLNHVLPEVPAPSISEENVSSTPASPARPGSASGSSKSASPLQTIFRAYAKFGDIKADGKGISLSQSDKWMKQAKVIDGKKITTTDTGIYFKKLKHQKLAFPDYLKFVEDLAKNKKVDLEEIKTKLVECGPPAVAGTTAAVKSSAVDRLTDSAKFTGSHKQRFDSAGRGRGIEGRKDAPGTGYVSGYNNKDTYDTTH